MAYATFVVDACNPKLDNTSFEVVLETTQGNQPPLIAIRASSPHPLFGPHCWLAHPTNNVNYSLVTTKVPVVAHRNRTRQPIPCLVF
jgi:hypothetical protein